MRSRKHRAHRLWAHSGSSGPHQASSAAIRSPDASSAARSLAPRHSRLSRLSRFLRCRRVSCGTGAGTSGALTPGAGALTPGASGAGTSEDAFWCSTVTGVVPCPWRRVSDTLAKRLGAQHSLAYRRGGASRDGSSASGFIVGVTTGTPGTRVSAGVLCSEEPPRGRSSDFWDSGETLPALEVSGIASGTASGAAGSRCPVTPRGQRGSVGPPAPRVASGHEAAAARRRSRRAPSARSPRTALSSGAVSPARSSTEPSGSGTHRPGSFKASAALGPRTTAQWAARWARARALPAGSSRLPGASAWLPTRRAGAIGQSCGAGEGVGKPCRTAA